VAISNNSGKPFKGKVSLQAESFNSDVLHRIKSIEVEANSSSADLQLVIDYHLGNRMQLWNEFSPALYKLTVNLTGPDGKILDLKTEDFGMREFKVNGTRLP